MGRGTIQNNRYVILVDDDDPNCLTLQGKEYWPDDFITEDKSMVDIIINAANYSAVKKDEYYFTNMDRVLWVEPFRTAGIMTMKRWMNFHLFTRIACWWKNR